MAHATIQSHSYELFEDLQMSSDEFYKMLHEMIREYQFPNVEVERETLKEAGFLSSKREYLRISKKERNFYVCAAPFGKSFFISWWLKEQEDGLTNMVDKVPLIGGLFSGKNRPKTFYELDSEVMFVSAINAIIQRAVDAVKAKHGYTQEVTQ